MLKINCIEEGSIANYNRFSSRLSSRIKTQAEITQNAQFSKFIIFESLLINLLVAFIYSLCFYPEFKTFMIKVELLNLTLSKYK